MQTTAKGEQKVLSQYITIYQEILSFSLEKVWLEIILKHNKSDADNMIDDINDKLIEVCDEYLKENKLPLDKFQLALIIMQLHSKTIASLEAPYKVIAKESKALVQEYLEKNSKKREALERIINENKELDEQLAIQEQEKKTKKKEIAKPVIDEEEYEPQLQPQPKPKKQKKGAYRKGLEDMLIDNSFTLPI